MKKCFNVKGKKGSISIFVLVALLFMSAFLIILFAANTGKIKIVDEQFNIIQDIYSHSGGDQSVYDKTYTDLRNKNRQLMTASVEGVSSIELTKTFEEDFKNYRIYGNSITHGKKNIYLNTLGFLPIASGSDYPVTNGSYPNATYDIIEIKKGQTLNFYYSGSNIQNLRVRYIDSSTEKILGDVGAEENSYYISTMKYSNVNPQNGYITAKQDFKLGIMYIETKPDDFNLTIGYDKEYKSVGDEKNIFNGKLKQGCYWSENGIYENVSDYVCSANPIYVDPNKTYTIVIPKEVNWMVQVIVCYDINGNWLGHIGEPSTFKPLENTAYIHVDIHKLDGYDPNITPEEVGNIQIEEGSTKTDYIPYKTSKITIKSTGETEDRTQTISFYISAPLRKYGDSVDYLDFKTGKIIRNVGVADDGEIYELSTPIEEYVEFPVLKAFEDYTKVEVLTEIPPSKIEVEYMGYTITSLLPSEYIQLQYIESTGTQYVDTEFIPNSNTSIEMKVASLATTNLSLYCARTNATNNTYTAFLIDGSSLRVDYYNTHYSDVAIFASDTARVYKQDKNLVYIDGQLEKTLSESEFSTSYNMTLLASRVGNSTLENMGNAKLYYCKIWDNGTLVRDFIPCKRTADGAVGLYDTVNKVFYGNAATTGDDFTAGPEA